MSNDNVLRDGAECTLALYIGSMTDKLSDFHYRAVFFISTGFIIVAIKVNKVHH